jgi:N utilization substance protein B
MREIVFLLLYSLDTGMNEEHTSLALIMRELQVSRSNVYQALARALRMREQQPALDALIIKSVQGYSFERIQCVERNILRLAIFELTGDGEVPPKAAISEAMRLARKFATPESANFINAVLDAIYKSSIGESPDARAIEASAQKKEAQESASSSYEPQ